MLDTLGILLIHGDGGLRDRAGDPARPGSGMVPNDEPGGSGETRDPAVAPRPLNRPREIARAQSLASADLCGLRRIGHRRAICLYAGLRVGQHVSSARGRLHHPEPDSGRLGHGGDCGDQLPADGSAVSAAALARDRPDDWDGDLGHHHTELGRSSRAGVGQVEYRDQDHRFCHVHSLCDPFPCADRGLCPDLGILAGRQLCSLRYQDHILGRWLRPESRPGTG